MLFRATSGCFHSSWRVTCSRSLLRIDNPYFFSLAAAIFLVRRSTSLPFCTTTRTTTTTTTTRTSTTAKSTASITTTTTSLPAWSDNNDSRMPQRPHSYRSSVSVTVDLSRIAEKAKLRETRRQEGYDFSRKLQVALIRAQDAVWTSSPDEKEATETLDSLMMREPMTSTDQSDSDNATDLRVPRDANLSIRMEDYVRLTAFRHFLVTSTLLPPPVTATDEEYLAGACMGLAQDLQRYGLGRATVRDTESIKAASLLVSEILEYLLQLDFRNGPLRRKYDGTKWCLRGLETLLYELAITSGEGSLKINPQDHVSKRMKQESSLLPNDELDGIKKRMEHRDNLRENLIKLCRDAQKAAKQSIFALHRGDLNKAAKLIATCEACIVNDLLPIVQEEPNLRQGSFAAVMEEYIEARLFATWIGSDPNKPTGEIVSDTDFAIEVEPEEYVGGLCDLTGEIGRFAVQRGTVRDVESVQLCLQTNQAVLTSLQMMECWPTGTGKKVDLVRTSVDKIQRMLYEMSLSEAAGGRNVKSDVEMEDVHTSDDNVQT